MAYQKASIGKAPGPDALPNEIIKFLLDTAHDLIFTLFQLMARHSYTPKKWCVSATKLTNKPNKTNPHNPANYRPIALMNCILKLWTSILTILGTETAESEGVFSDTADGFRPHRNIYDSLSTHITMYEDAKLSQQKIIHSILRLQRRIRRHGPPHPLSINGGIWVPALLYRRM